VQAQFSKSQVQPGLRVVVENKLITSLAAGSAMEFAYEIVRQLRGPEAVDKVNQGVCASQAL
jgi:4-methyl-5(b-hydroxyethyl)-thiazole monophosphate biosynthesis